MPVRQIRIALIEDSPTVRMFYKKLFEKAGFEVLEAENAKEGWNIICNQKPDVIVLDMMMPEIPGIELLKRIRSYDYSKNIPVLVLTSIKEPDKVKEIYKYGADHYTLKGMDSPDMIKQTVYQLLKKEQEKQVHRKLEGQDSDNVDIPDIDRHFFWFESDLG
ncbi:response regulator [bacterium]|nr:response regulator [bacterium]